MREQYENKEAKRDKLNRFAVAPQKVDADGESHRRFDDLNIQPFFQSAPTLRLRMHLRL